MSQYICWNCNAELHANDTMCWKCETPQSISRRFVIQRKIGSGGFAQVYEALDRRTNKRCAVKVVCVDEPQKRQQANNEIAILSKHLAGLSFVPRLIDAQRQPEQYYLVLDLIEGKTVLPEDWPEHFWFPGRVLRFLKIMLGHLAVLHQHKVIHRDINPVNIIRTPEREYVLLDFGIARVGAATGPGIGFGTPAYCSIEQLYDEDQTTERSDLYSLGAVAYHLLTGTPPPTALERDQGAELVPPSAVRRGVPPALEAVILALMALEPHHRPSSARAALAQLHEVRTLPINLVQRNVIARSMRIRRSLRTRRRLVVPVRKALLKKNAQTALDSIAERFAIFNQIGQRMTQLRWMSLATVALAALLVIIVIQRPNRIVIGGTLPQQSSQPPILAATATMPSPAGWGHMLFSAAGEGDYDLYEIGGGRSVPAMIIAHPGNDVMPTWSPNGRWIAFVGHDQRPDNDIFLLSADREWMPNITNHPADDISPAFSPDSQRLAFASNRSGEYRLYMFDIGSNVVTQLLLDPYPARDPTWLDNQHLLFVSQREGGWGLFELNTETQKVQPLYYGIGELRAPALSHNKQTIAFLQYDGQKWTLQRIEHAGAKANLLAINLDADSTIGWSEDDRWLVFTRRALPQDQPVLVSIPANGGAEEMVLLGLHASLRDSSVR